VVHPKLKGKRWEEASAAGLTGMQASDIMRLGALETMNIYLELAREFNRTEKGLRDEFLSEEDLDLQSLSDEELDAVWTAWLYQAQATNEEDRLTYSNGVFTEEPGP
jgi:hypothetical protein